MNYLSQLKSIIKASGWSQEQIARELDVSFATLNAWINERAQPRQRATLKIEQLYLRVIGVETVDEAILLAAKKNALSSTMNSKKLVNNRPVLDKLILHLTYHTNTIEGSTMTLADVKEVVFDHKVLSNRTAIEQAEARNHQAALLWILDQLVARQDLVIDEDLIKSVNLRLMNGIISNAGQYRRHTVRIMGTHVTLANWLKVPELMQKFSEDQSQTGQDIIANMAQAHAKFEQIHPFSDGNGRTGRLLLLAQALKAGLVPPLVVKERRQAYYKYLELAQTKADYKPLELFMAQSITQCQELLS